MFRILLTLTVFTFLAITAVHAANAECWDSGQKMDYDPLEGMINKFCDEHHDKRAKPGHPVEAKIDHPGDSKTYVKLAYEAFDTVDNKDGFRVDKAECKKVLNDIKMECTNDKKTKGGKVKMHNGWIKLDPNAK
ncbi:hypothetical protein EX30DRAFT_398925 [Ascodesmis nigricans]|uniref:Uncharacterized protein n=1 Tax=Ascodesmis nigricans TaxID=341454 RepID=A0A4S2MQZ2_9PEZI|nr:hypothetical protein EX30DRAFT_398925 [Ascodesmis nigricans]